MPIENEIEFKTAQNKNNNYNYDTLGINFKINVILIFDMSKWFFLLLETSLFKLETIKVEFEFFRIKEKKRKENRKFGKKYKDNYFNFFFLLHLIYLTENNFFFKSMLKNSLYTYKLN